MTPKIELDVEKMIKDYLNIKSVTIVSRMYGVSVNTIHRRLKEKNIDRVGVEAYRHSAKGCTDEQEMQILDLYNEGKSIKDISVLLNSTSHIVLSALKRNKIKRRRRGNVYRAISDENVIVICDLYKNGFSQEKIANKLNLGQIQISRVLKANNISTLKYKEDHPNWKGGRLVTSGGYINVYIESNHKYYSMATRMGYMMEHRLVMAEKLGRPLTKDETVHHINGKRDDNRIENLQLRKGKHGRGVVYKCSDCGSYHIIEDKLTEE